MSWYRFLPFLALVGCATVDPDEPIFETEDLDSTELALSPPTGAYVGPSRKCLVVNGASTADGTAIVASDCIGAVNAKWSPDPATGYIRGWAGKCLTGSNGRIVLSTCANLTAQKWTSSGGRLRNNLGTCASMSTSNGVPAILATCTTSAAQQIVFEPVRRLRVQAVFVSDDSGGNAPVLTAQQLQSNLARANVVYAPAHVQFVFDPATDVSMLRDTGINRLACLGTDDQHAIGRARMLAGRYEGRILLLIRRGDGSGRSCSSGPAGGDRPFVTFRNTWADDHVLAHELGHYLGLGHTFILDPNGNPYDTAAKVRTFYNANGNNPAVFDADRFEVTDTPGDVGPQLWQSVGWAKCDPARTSFAITDTFSLTPDRFNVMSYWDCPNQRLTAQQILRVRAQIELPMRRTLIDPLPAPSAARMIFGYAGHCLTDLNPTPAAGDMLVLAPCTDAGSKTWTFGAGGEIRTWNGLCVKEGPPFALRRPTLAACTGAWDQKFVRSGDGDLKTPSGLCLASDNDSRSSRGNLVLFACAPDELNKFWSYLPRPTGGVN